MTVNDIQLRNLCLEQWKAGKYRTKLIRSCTIVSVVLLHFTSLFLIQARYPTLPLVC